MQEGNEKLTEKERQEFINSLPVGIVHFRDDTSSTHTQSNDEKNSD